MWAIKGSNVSKIRVNLQKDVLGTMQLNKSPNQRRLQKFSYEKEPLYLETEALGVGFGVGLQQIRDG